MNVNQGLKEGGRKEYWGLRNDLREGILIRVYKMEVGRRIRF